MKELYKKMMLCSFQYNLNDNLNTIKQKIKEESGIVINEILKDTKSYAAGQVVEFSNNIDIYNNEILEEIKAYKQKQKEEAEKKRKAEKITQETKRIIAKYEKEFANERELQKKRTEKANEKSMVSVICAISVILYIIVIIYAIIAK